MSVGAYISIFPDGEQVRATGEVALNNNSLLIKPLDSELQKLSGKFRFDNGNLQSDPLSATGSGSRWRSTSPRRKALATTRLTSA